MKEGIMKTIKKSINIFSILSLFVGVFSVSVLFTSCGKKKSNSNDNHYNPGGYRLGEEYGRGGGGHLPGGGAPGNITDALRQVEGQTRCTRGQRLPPKHFISHESTGVWYAGKSPAGDIIFIQEVGQGVPVRGYNVILSLCTSCGHVTCEIGRGAPLAKLQLHNVHLTHSPQCSVKKVGKAEVHSGAWNYPIVFSPIRGCY